VGAAAYELHDKLVEQLKAPGRMFIPVGDKSGQAIYVVDKDKDGNITKKKAMDVWVRPYLFLSDLCSQSHSLLITQV
jgi:protein-L-isoaspartate(D-aspartate) O-methyltransferase